ncbi:General transcription factor 3C polypeptide 3, partial [Stegodyphus mimosarum]
MPDREIDAPDELETFTDDDFKVVLNCYVPEVLPVDLAVKVLLCLIHLQSLTAVQPLLEALILENPEDFGDLYLDVAEAFMEIKEYEFAKTLLSKLLKTDNYNL